MDTELDAPVHAITNNVPRIPISRLLISIDFMIDPLIEVYENLYLLNQGSEVNRVEEGLRSKMLGRTPFLIL